MAIMWNAPADTPSLEETPAEVQWRLWLLKTLAASGGEEPVEEIGAADAGEQEFAPAESEREQPR